MTFNPNPNPNPNPRPLSAGRDPYLQWALETKFAYCRKPDDRPMRVAVLPSERMPQTPTRLARGEVAASVDISHGLPTRGRAYTDHVNFVDGTKGISDLEMGGRVVFAEPGMGSVGRSCRAEERPHAKGKSVKIGCVRQGSRVVIGVVDGRLAFANARFQDSNRESRIHLFWDQSAQSLGDKGWTRPANFKYGRQLDREALNKILEKLPEVTPGDDKMDWSLRQQAERAEYLRLGHALPADSNWSHGTHVLDTILSAFNDENNNKNKGDCPPVIYVQLPDDHLRDTSGHWIAANVLDGVHYILNHVHKDDQIVINLSLGSFGGPHDGSSLLEQALDDLIDEYGGRLVVVVAAGNAGRVLDDGTGEPRVCHARLQLEGNEGSEEEPSFGAQVSLDWHIDRADDTESFLEVWTPVVQGASHGTPVRVWVDHVDAVTDVRRTNVLGTVNPGEFSALPMTGKPSAGGVEVAVFNGTGKDCQVPNGNGGLVVVALGHTSDSTGGAHAATGHWIVRIANLSPQPITLDAWSERRDIPGELPGCRPQYGFVNVNSHALRASPGTLGSLATGAKTIVVGALESDVRQDIEMAIVSEYSSVGVGSVVGDCNPRKVIRRGPDLFSRGELSAQAFLSGHLATLAGTSMAAARVTGLLALDGLSKKLPIARLERIEKLLRNHAKEVVRRPDRVG